LRTHASTRQHLFHVLEALGPPRRHQQEQIRLRTPQPRTSLEDQLFLAGMSAGRDQQGAAAGHCLRLCGSRLRLTGCRAVHAGVFQAPRHLDALRRRAERHDSPGIGLALHGKRRDLAQHRAHEPSDPGITSGRARRDPATHHDTRNLLPCRGADQRRPDLGLHQHQASWAQRAHGPIDDRPPIERQQHHGIDGKAGARGIAAGA
jgi:hypothetical protein